LRRTPLCRRTPLKRTPIRSKAHPPEWRVAPELAEYVLNRDGGCIAPRVDPKAGPCSGRVTLDHVKTSLRMAERAPSDKHHLVSVCEGHSENGAKAGHQWNTASRELERKWLLDKEGPHEA
jgi:hypothetical protein